VPQPVGQLTLPVQTAVAQTVPVLESTSSERAKVSMTTFSHKATMTDDALVEDIRIAERRAAHRGKPSPLYCIRWFFSEGPVSIATCKSGYYATFHESLYQRLLATQRIKLYGMDGAYLAIIGPTKVAVRVNTTFPGSKYYECTFSPLDIKWLQEGVVSWLVNWTFRGARDECFYQVDTETVDHIRPFCETFSSSESD
jgi:hypothetical protein